MFKQFIKKEGFMATSNDLTELKKLENMYLENLAETFTNQYLWHDVKTPLKTIKGEDSRKEFKDAYLAYLRNEENKKRIKNSIKIILDHLKSFPEFVHYK